MLQEHKGLGGAQPVVLPLALSARMRARKRTGVPLALIYVRFLDAVLNGDPIVLLVVQRIAGEDGKRLDKRLQILCENPTIHGDDLLTRAVNPPQPSERSPACARLITHVVAVWYVTILQWCLRTWYLMYP